MRKTLFAAALSAVSFIGSAHALTVKQYLPGYRCMMLNVSHEQMMDFAHPVMFKASPDDGASNALTATPQVAVKIGAPNVNGFTEVLQMNGKPAWIRSGLLAPFYLKDAPQTPCKVAVMSDGSVGFSHH
mgnify:CR=1 FL=1